MTDFPRAFAVNEARLPEQLFTLRQKLYTKAKREPAFRFYTLYGLIARLDVLEAAWALVAANDGAPGVDGVTITAIRTSPGGAAALVATLHRETRGEDVPASRGATRIHPEGGWQTATARHSHGP